MLGRTRTGILFLLPFLLSCGDSDSDPLPEVSGSLEGGETAVESEEWIVDTSVEYTPVVSEPTWIAPGADLPAQAHPMTSNNNVAIELHEGRLYMAWRTAEIHFASVNAKMYLISSPDMGATWEWEHTIAVGADVREPTFLSINGNLIFHYMELGTNPLGFEPKGTYRIVRTDAFTWSEPVAIGVEGEVPWDLKVRNGKAWMTSYVGNHYGTGASAIEVYFQVSDDGLSWSPVGSAGPTVYTGGVSEVGIEFDGNGNLWAVTRNEDGDATGFGSHVVTADSDDLGNWQFPAESDPERYDSPRMFRHGDDLYLIARRDIGGPFDMGYDYLPDTLKKAAYLAAYSLRQKRTALYRIDQQLQKVVWIQDLPSAGDCSFPSIVRTGADTFLVANYTSPPEDETLTWIEGQISPQGTQIYFVTITFQPE